MKCNREFYINFKRQTPYPVSASIISSIQFYCSFSLGALGFCFQHFSPTKAPAADTTIITANTIRYDNTILKNSGAFRIKVN